MLGKWATPEGAGGLLGPVVVTVSGETKVELCLARI